tara:strand:- start:565 stop:849 length:285 start_codon:yes stop_codon:yes gene_type:complete
LIFCSILFQKNNNLKICVFISGLVGKALQQTVGQAENWTFLSSADGDLRSFTESQQIFERHKPTHVIHLAAIVGGLFHNMVAGADLNIMTRLNL